MDLSLAASYFDDIVASDAYDSSSTFYCQIDPLSLFKIDATAVRRREISCAPNVTIPARRAITIDGITFLVGDVSPDFFMGDRIRDNYVVQGANYLATFTSIAGELASTAGTQVYVSRDFSKFQTDSRETSDYFSQYQVFASGTETQPELIKIGSTYYLVRDGYTSVSGFLSMMANEVPDPAFETITFAVRTYAPATDTWSQTTSSVPIFRIRWTEDFKYFSRDSTDYERGDLQVFILKSALTPKVSDKLTLSDGTFEILSIRSDGSCWSCHVRR